MKRLINSDRILYVQSAVINSFLSVAAIIFAKCLIYWNSSKVDSGSGLIITVGRSVVKAAEETIRMLVQRHIETAMPAISCQRSALRAGITVWLFVTILLSTEGYQFILESRSKRCFREDIPLGTEALFTYTIAQGSGDMTVNVRVTDALGKEQHKHVEADHGSPTVRVPERFPTYRGQNEWSIRDDDKGDGADALMRQYPDAVGDNRMPYFFCFEHPTSLHLPRLSSRENAVRRRVIFDVKYGTESRGKEFYDELAKEKHLTTTEEMFHVVEDRVSEVIRKIDEMRQREHVMDYMSAKTSQLVGLYGVLACVAIGVGAVFTSHATLSAANQDKRPKYR